ncbi:DUF3794 and LysM peptidoglycan-binding domain-containing protein [Fonticella tunisiensis]|uniref:Uncharacterized protein DUF3794 n=1 Tax=Fonticella tunisiensis TaxID=1096341 RepID=A0A4R7KT72_9CLOT|nr:SPOCS domain-containing protein [Fonticella tunisiensis]TDT62339.1 uncharacterized protein DUF3794 [Fonticella tunisiensis]
MSVELIRDMINYEKLIGEGISQTMVNGDIVIPERNPEIAKVLNMDTRVSILSSEVVEDRIIIEGKMDFDILYSSSDDNRGIYKVSATSNFTHNIQVPGALPRMSCKIATNIEHKDYEPINAPTKKIKVNAVVNIKGMVYEKEAAETIVDIKGEDVQILKDKVRVDEYVGDNSQQTIIKGKIEIPEDMEEVKDILKYNVHIHKKDVSVYEGKIVVNACALMEVVYDTRSNDIKHGEQDVAFTHEIEMPEVKPGMKCDENFRIDDVICTPVENEAGEKRAIEIEAGVSIGVKVFMTREMENIIDAYSSQARYEIEKENIKVTSLFGENSDSQTIKERIVLPEDQEPIDVVKYMVTNPIITDVKIVEDKVIVEGVVNCSLMYTVTDDRGMTSFEEELPFKSTVEIPGTRIDMISEVDVNIEHASHDKVSQKEVDIKIIVGCSAKVFYKINMDIVKSVVEAEIPDNIKNMPTIVIYMVQPNDTLWKIAKKYCTTVEDILKLNDLENPDHIEAGMKLLIPKKMFIK